MNKILTIGIPTYNRDKFLEQCLESIASQMTDSQVAEKVELVISDNASSDSTEQIVQKFRERIPSLNYFKNSENLGVDRNILQVVEKSQGEYVWMLGDDDALFPDSLSYMLQRLEKPEFKYCVVNCWGYDKALLNHALNHPNMTISSDQHFARLSDYVEKSAADKDMVGFFCGLSVQVFNRALWNNVEDKDQYIGTNAVHLFVLLTAMKDKSFALLAKPLVKVRADNIRWDVFPGLETIKKRTQSTYSILEWIIKKYNIPYSKSFFKLGMYKDLALLWTATFIRKNLFKSQSSRDKLKKLLGKL
jgi:abequosyltransferase